MVQFQDSISKHLHLILFPTCFLIGHLKLIMPEFYHVMALGQAFGLQFDQFSQPFNYLPQFFSQNFGHDLDYHIHQL